MFPMRFLRKWRESISIPPLVGYRHASPVGALATVRCMRLLEALPLSITTECPTSARTAIIVATMKIGRIASGRKPASYDLRKLGILSLDIAKMNPCKKHAIPNAWRAIALWEVLTPSAPRTTTNPRSTDHVNQDGM